MPKILLVDDEESILRSTSMLLTDLGFEVTMWGSAQGIVEEATLQQPDAILQDIRMPGLDIDALVRGLRACAATAAIPLVLFSASLELDEVASRLRAAGALVKPFRPAQLRAALEQALPH